MTTNDAIQAVICQACDYMQRRVQAGAQAPLGTEAWRAAAQAVDAAALTGDLDATREACRAWWGLLAPPPAPTAAEQED